MKNTADVVIIGAGVIGCSTAYHLARMGLTDVVVLEMGQVGSGTSSKSASMLSLQYPHDELSVRMAKYCYARYMDFAQEMGTAIDFRRTGWVTLAGWDQAGDLRKHALMLRENGIPTEIWTPAEAKRRFPELYVEDIALVTYGPDDGPFDPHMIMWGYVKQARTLGVKIREGVRALGICIDHGRIQGVESTGGTIATPIVINAAGPWANQVGRWVGVDVPLRNAIRGIIVTGPVPAFPTDRPFVEDLTQGWYCRPEGDGVLMGMGVIPTHDLEPVFSDDLLDAMIEAATHRIPALEQAAMRTRWAGIRPLTADDRPILGPVPGAEGFLLNCGWGGTGIIQAPIAGQLLAELVALGRTETLDIDAFWLGRF